jgi:hypothetical protein
MGNNREQIRKQTNVDTTNTLCKKAYQCPGCKKNYDVFSILEKYICPDCRLLCVHLGKSEVLEMEEHINYTKNLAKAHPTKHFDKSRKLRMKEAIKKEKERQQNEN